MKFDEAFNAAAKQALAETCAGPRTWWQFFRGQRRKPWRPTSAERIKASEAIRLCCRDSMRERGELPSGREMKIAAVNAIGTGPLTVLWIAVMVARLLATLKELMGREG